MVQRKGALELSYLPGKLADCQERDPEQLRAVHRRGRFRRRLRQAGPRAQVPGDPAAARQNPQRREGPLRQDAVSSQEIATLITALGCGIGEEKDDSQAPLPPHHHHDRRRRRRLAHPHPAAHLLLPAFPEIIENGHLYIAQPPLYKVKKGKKELYLKNEQALEEHLIDSSTSDDIALGARGSSSPATGLRRCAAHRRAKRLAHRLDKLGDGRIVAAFAEVGISRRRPRRPPRPCRGSSTTRIRPLAVRAHRRARSQPARVRARREHDRLRPCAPRAAAAPSARPSSAPTSSSRRSSPSCAVTEELKQQLAAPFQLCQGRRRPPRSTPSTISPSASRTSAARACHPALQGPGRDERRAAVGDHHGSRARSCCRSGSTTASRPTGSSRCSWAISSSRAASSSSKRPQRAQPRHLSPSSGTRSRRP